MFLKQRKVELFVAVGMQNKKSISIVLLIIIMSLKTKN